MEEKFKNDIVSFINKESPGELEAWLRRTLVDVCGNITFENLDNDKKTLWSDFIDSQIKAESPFAERFLTLVCQDKAKEISSFFSVRPKLFREFFFQNEQRISKWFKHFSFNDPPLYGAKALEQYLFKHRDVLWDKLVWTGKRANPPNVVANRLYLMMELDVYRAVCDVLCADDAFWESEYFQQSLEDGSFLSIDYPFFTKTLFRLCNDGGGPDKKRVLDTVHSYALTAPLREIVSESVFSMTRHSAETLLDFVRCFTSCLSSLEQWDPRASKATLAALLIGKAGFTEIDDMLCVNALLTQSCQVRKMLDSEVIDRADAKDVLAFIEGVELSSCCYTRADMRSYALKGAGTEGDIVFTAVKSFMWYSAVLDITKGLKAKKAAKKLNALLSTTDYNAAEVGSAELCLLDDIPRKKRKVAHNHKTRHKKDEWTDEMKMLFGGTDNVDFDAIRFAWEIKLHGRTLKFSLSDAADVLQQKFLEEFCDELKLIK